MDLITASLNHSPSEARQSACFFTGCQEQRLFEDFFAVVGNFERTVFIYRKGEIIEGVFAREYVMAQQNTGPEKVRPLEFRERCGVFT